MKDILIKYQNYSIKEILLILDSYESIKHDYEILKQKVIELEKEYTELKNDFIKPWARP